MDIQGKNVSLREAVEEDIPQILTIENEANPTPWSEKGLRSELNGKNKFWVLTDDETDEKIYGFLLFSIVAEESHILEVAIDSKYRRKGIGRFILQRMISFVMKEGVESIYLEVRQSNSGGVEFYQNLGFVIVHKKVSYYSDGADAYSMIFRISSVEANVEGPKIKQ